MKTTLYLVILSFYLSSAYGQQDLIVKSFSKPNAPLPEVKPYSFDPKAKHPLGVRPDCTEKKVSVKEFEALASTKTNSTVDFLKSLPEDSFQTFTLITNSKSAQRCEGEGIVSDEWPRVLRTSADGKITFSYTCNPKSCVYNQIEVIYYDDDGRSMKTMSLDFNKKPKERVEHNSGKCLACHGNKLPSGEVTVKPIWPEYFQWGGCDGSNTINMYGSNDDNMDPNFYREGSDLTKEYKACDNEKIKERKLKEIDYFNKFKQKNLGTGVNNNPCYSSLPWAKPTGQAGGQFDPAKYKSYPYASDKEDITSDKNSDGLENYYLRPNLKFTEMYSRINAKRIAGLMQRSPQFEKIKYFLALESAGCLKEEDTKIINNMLPAMNYEYKERSILGSDTLDPRNSGPLLYAYGKYIGLSDSEWTLEYKGGGPKYNAAIPRRAQSSSGYASMDVGISEVASAEILKMVANDNPNLTEVTKNAYARGVAESFGPQWSCIDDLGGPVREGFQLPQRPLCQALRQNLPGYLPPASSEGGECIPDPSPKAHILKEDVRIINEELDEVLIEKGKHLVETRCLLCHEGGGSDPGSLSQLEFFENTKKTTNPQVRASMREKIKTGVASNVSEFLKSGYMPYDGSKLTEEEQKAILHYVESLRSGKN